MTPAETLTPELAEVLTLRGGPLIAAQRKLALQRANGVRTARGQLRRQLGDAADRVPALTIAVQHIAENPEWLATQRVVDLLCQCRKVGPSFARRLMLEAGVGDRATVGGLTSRQCSALAAVVRRLGAPERQA